MKFLNKIINADIILCTVFVFSLIFGLSKIEINLDFIDVIGKMTDTFETTDLVYTALRDEPAPDTQITMVNIGNLDRGGIAQLITNLNKAEPAVIGIDVRFFKDKTNFYVENGMENQDSLLEIAFSQTKNLVLATKLENFNEFTGQWDSLTTPLPRFRQYSNDGFVNVITAENDFRVNRKITPIDFVKDSMQIFFPVKISSLYSKEKTDKFLNRAKNKLLIANKRDKTINVPEDDERLLETIYYRGNINNFYGEKDPFGNGDAFNKIDAFEGLEGTFDPNLVKGKICFLGYLGETIKNDKYWDEDKFYTPLNKKFAGKSFPDMYGVIVHANIVSMILNETYIEIIDQQTNFIINIIICLLNVVLFSYIHNYIKLWWDGLSVVVALGEMILLYAIVLICFEYYRLEIDLNYAVAFIFLLGNLLELYYEYAKPGLQWTFKKVVPLAAKK
ncbi:MAG: CHASE2 domain-containing protein [Cytophagales bacterium]